MYIFNNNLEQYTHHSCIINIKQLSIAFIYRQNRICSFNNVDNKIYFYNLQYFKNMRSLHNAKLEYLVY